MWIYCTCWAISNGTRHLNLGNCVCQCPYQYIHFGYLHLSLCTWVWIMPNKSGVELRQNPGCPGSQSWTLPELEWNFILLRSHLPIFFIPEPPELIVRTLGGSRNITSRKTLLTLNLIRLKILCIFCWNCIWRQFIYICTKSRSGTCKDSCTGAG